MRRKILFTVYSATLVVLSILVGCDKNDTETDYVFSTGESVIINGITWATSNVDAPGSFAETPESPGKFYQWSRKVGWSATDDPRINSDGDTTWDSSIPEGTEWEPVNDPCPSGWRVPTHDEQESLLDSGSSWTTQNGVTGRIFGSGGNTLFLPAAGCRYGYDGSLSSTGTDGNYWSRDSFYWSQTDDDNYGAHYLSFGSVYAGSSRYNSRGGFSVRCVQE